MANDHGVFIFTAKMDPMNLIWSESAQWLLTSSVRKIQGALIMPVGMPLWLWRANENDVAHVQVKMVPMNLIWSELAQWLRNSGIHKIPRALIMAIWPKWANDHDARYLLAKTIPMNLIQSESAQWLQSYGVLKDWADWLDKWTDGRTDRDNSIVTLFFLQIGRANLS